MPLGVLGVSVSPAFSLDCLLTRKTMRTTPATSTSKPPTAPPTIGPALKSSCAPEAWAPEAEVVELAGPLLELLELERVTVESCSRVLGVGEGSSEEPLVRSRVGVGEGLGLGEGNGVKEISGQTTGKPKVGSVDKLNQAVKSDMLAVALYKVVAPAWGSGQGKAP